MKIGRADRAIVRRIACSLLALTATLVSFDAYGACIRTDKHIREVLVLDCEDPAPYIERGEQRIREWLHDMWETTENRTIDTPPTYDLYLNPEEPRGVVLSLLVLRERAVSYELTPDHERQLRPGSTWVDLKRHDRVWWMEGDLSTCDLFPRDERITIFVQPSCCADLPPARIDCVTLLDRASPLPTWVTHAEFIDGEGDCLQLRDPDSDLSRLGASEALYRWLADHYPGYTLIEHSEPATNDLEKEGCFTGHGSRVLIRAADGTGVSTCFCLPREDEER